VVLNTAFGEPTIAVDTHIFRVANRTGLAPGKTPRGRGKAAEARARRVPPRRPPLADPARPLRLQGAQAGWARGGWTLGAYGQALDGRGPDAALVARGIADGDWGDGMHWHLGASLSSERPQDDRSSISLRPDGGPSQPGWLGSGTLAADRVDRIGLEAGLQGGDWLLLGEHLQARLDAPGGGSRRADGHLVTLAWTVHGDPRKPKGGLFTTPDPRPGALGAVELALRYAEVELPRADGSRRGSDSLALGVNAQVGRHARVQLSRHRHARDFDDVDAALWTLRVQFQY
jgi:phosphate-selective porin